MDSDTQLDIEQRPNTEQGSQSPTTRTARVAPNLILETNPDHQDVQSVDGLSQNSHYLATGGRKHLIVSTLFNNAQYSDLTIRLGTTGITLPAHRLVLGPWFSGLEQTPQNEIVLLTWHRVTVHTVWRVLRYIYEGDYQDRAEVELEWFGL